MRGTDGISLTVVSVAAASGTAVCVSRRIFIRASPLSPSVSILSLRLPSSSISLDYASSISVVTTTESLRCQWGLTSHSRDCITDISVPFINGTWHIENCFAHDDGTDGEGSAPGSAWHYRFYSQCLSIKRQL